MTSKEGNIHNHHKALLKPLRDALYDFELDSVKAVLNDVFHEDSKIRLCFPFETIEGVETYFNKALKPLNQAIPDLERRDTIVIAGTTEHGDHWVGCCGYYTGSFLKPWLDIPPTGHQVGMRFHEFYRFQNDKVIEMQAIWDIPELMMQANAWPMAPSLGREWQIPAPATMDGISTENHDEIQSQASCNHIVEMLDYMTKHPSQGGPEVMQLERFWHPKMSWYGPAGIGTARGIAGFRHWHQIPFLNAMPDRGQQDEEITFHFFGDGNYAAVTGWPDMKQTISNDGWMGIAAAGQKVEMRSLDFWRIEKGLIRENWVLVDLLSIYDQLGVDVFARLREFNKARNMGDIYLNNVILETEKA